MDDNERALLRQIALEASLLERCNPATAAWPYRSRNHLLLQEGRLWRRGARARVYRRGVPKHCFENSMKLVLRHPELTYCEGIALAIIPVPHAWCLTPDGDVIDTTWEPGWGLAYLGVAFDADYVRDHYARHEELTLLDDWRNGHPLLSLTGELARAIAKGGLQERGRRAEPQTLEPLNDR